MKGRSFEGTFKSSSVLGRVTGRIQRRPGAASGGRRGRGSVASTEHPRPPLIIETNDGRADKSPLPAGAGIMGAVIPPRDQEKRLLPSRISVEGHEQQGCAGSGNKVSTGREEPGTVVPSRYRSVTAAFPLFIFDINIIVNKYCYSNVVCRHSTRTRACIRARTHIQAHAHACAHRFPENPPFPVTFDARL